MSAHGSSSAAALPLLQSTPSMAAMPLCQIAISTTHLLRTHHWYQRALGFLAAGPRRHREVPGRSEVTDLPESALDVWCLVDRRDWLQLELIEFQRPRMRPMPLDWQPSDIGYSTIGIHVGDFDAALDRLGRTSGRPLTAPVGERGTRRVCLRDPEGVLLELMEDDVQLPGAPRPPRSGLAAGVRFVTLSVPDLARALRFWRDTLGLTESTLQLHGPEHEALWGLPGARRRAVSLWAGDFVIELVQYVDPVGRPRPAGQLLSDQGILNVAFGSPDRALFDVVYERIGAGGYQRIGRPWILPRVATVAYVTDDQGFSVELLHVEPSGLEEMGFLPSRSAASGEMHTDTGGNA